MYATRVSISPEDAANLVRNELDRGGTKIEDHVIKSEDGKTMVLMTYEEYFIRTDSRIGLCVVIENMTGETVARAISSGGGRGALLKLGFGANSDYENKVQRALGGVSLGAPAIRVRELAADGSTRAEVTAGWGGSYILTAHADRVQLDHTKKNKTSMFPYNKICAATAKKETLTIKLDDGTEESIIFAIEPDCTAWLALIEREKA